MTNTSKFHNGFNAKKAKTQKDISYVLGGDIDGTSLQGEIDCAYADLVAVIGEPNAEGDGYKVDAEWTLTIITPSGARHVASIYNYKSGQNYNGPDAPEVVSIRDWHIGGHKSIVAEYVQRILANKIKPRA